MKRCLLIIAIVTAGAGAACSPRPAQRRPTAVEPPAKTLLRADALVDRGCYLCLGEALDLYRQLLTAGFQPAVVRGRIFETATLMAVREREVGIVPAAGRPDAATAPASAGAVPYGDIVAAIPWRGAGMTSALPDIEPGVFEKVADWRPQLLPIADGGDVVAAYLLVALDCVYAAAPSQSALASYSAAHPASLALAFRTANCRPASEAVLRDIVRREPRFVEADLLLGDISARKGAAAEAEQHYRRVIDTLPRLPAAPIELGDLLNEGEEFEEALRLYDQALAVVADHRQALLGRIISLSNLERHQEAIGVCDTLVGLGTWYLGPAHYWRAWNLHELRLLDQAWDAIEAAKRYLQTADIFELSGIIAFDRNNPAQTRTDMEEALRRDKNMCRPPFYLGRVQMEGHEWPGAAARFSQAVGCYEAGAAATRQKVEELERSPLPDPRKAVLRVRLQNHITANERAAALSAYDAAVSYVGAGAIDQAIAAAERALRDDRLNAQAQELLAKLRKAGRWGGSGR